ncbi:MAG: protein kinase, partial [Longimicrobiales bacterium]|nr:protein kinase [Longimicrobiales bacterium]
YAHEQDVVHRDIKPANILMSRGEPLVADFGIALALSEAGGGRITETGLSLGTPHYMSPEQASGDQSLDKRSDVYALGCILYEMLTGEPPYGGPTAQSVLAKILTGDAQRITDLRKTVPPHVDAAVAKALEKLPADRFANAEAFVRALEDESFRHTTADRSVPRGPRPGVGGLLMGRPLVAVPIALGLLAAGLLLGVLASPDPPTRPVFKAALEIPEGQQVLEPPFGPSLALSRDGRTMVYTGPVQGTGASQGAGGWQLWLRRAESLEAIPVQGTTGAFTPTLSPAGDAVAFLDGNNDLVIVAIASATRRIIVENAGPIFDWTDDGVLYFGDNTGVRLKRVPAAGGEVETIEATEPAAGTTAGHGWTYGDVLPGGSRGLWTRLPTSGDLDEQQVGVLHFATGEFTPFAAGSSPRYFDSGHVVWTTRDGTVLASAFDVEAGEPTGPAVPVVRGVRTDVTGGVHAGFSATGDMVYREGNALGAGMRLVWVDRSGNVEEVDADWTVLPAAAGNWSGLDLSPDGDRVAATDGAGGGSQIWVKNLDDGTPPYRITFDGTFHVRPRWGPDGEIITFISNLGGDSVPTQVWAKAADGSGAPYRIHGAGVEIEEAVLVPGGWLVYRQGGTTANRDIYGIRPGQDSAGRPLMATDADEKSPQVSPDGRWLAYMSDETGQTEVFVRPFPDISGGKWQISQGGGGSPLWSNSGEEIFYLGFDGQLSLFSARLDLRESSLSVRGREALFGIGNQYTDANYTAFDVSPDDQRFLMFSLGQVAEGSMIWVQNWLTDWQRRAGEGM